MTRATPLTILLVALASIGAPCESVECQSNQACAGDDVCLDGVCVECEDDGDCDAGETCNGDNECEADSGDEGEGEEGEGEDPDVVTVVTALCQTMVGCGFQPDLAQCVQDGSAAINQVPDNETCSELRSAMLAFYTCASVQDCAFFEGGEPQPGGPCGDEFARADRLAAELGGVCGDIGEGEGEPPPNSCFEHLGVGDQCDCGCFFEEDADCRGAGCVEPGCVAAGCETCWEDEFEPGRCG